MKLDLPLQLGRYELIDELGRGGFGAVFRARMEGPMGFADHVAVKLVDPDLAIEEQGLLLALADEARLLSRLQHPNIVRLRGFEQVQAAGMEPMHALVLEWVQGITLEALQYHPPRGPGELIPLASVLAMFTEMIQALDYAHGVRSEDDEPLNLVHRDLKPGNVMIDRDGRLRLLDFGIAWATERLTRTGEGIAKGTPPYMSPEQIRGYVDRRSDLFVVGALVYEMIVGRPYVRRPRSPMELPAVLLELTRVHFDERKELLTGALRSKKGHGLRKKEAASLVELVGHLLELRPEDRPADAGEVDERLRDLSLPWSLRQGRKALAEEVRPRVEKAEVARRALAKAAGPGPAPGSAPEPKPGHQVIGDAPTLRLATAMEPPVERAMSTADWMADTSPEDAAGPEDDEGVADPSTGWLIGEPSADPEAAAPAAAIKAPGESGVEVLEVEPERSPSPRSGDRPPEPQTRLVSIGQVEARLSPEAEAPADDSPPGLPNPDESAEETSGGETGSSRSTSLGGALASGLGPRRRRTGPVPDTEST